MHPSPRTAPTLFLSLALPAGVAGCGAIGTSAGAFDPLGVSIAGGIGDTSESGQTFTPTRSGRVVQLDLRLMALENDEVATISVEIVPLDELALPAPSDEALGVSTINGALLDLTAVWAEASFRKLDVHVEEGETYAWVASAPDATWYQYAALGHELDRDGQPYEDGHMCSHLSTDSRVDDEAGSEWADCGGVYDLGFRLWVDPE